MALSSASLGRRIWACMLPSNSWVNAAVFDVLSWVEAAASVLSEARLTAAAELAELLAPVLGFDRALWGGTSS